MECTTCGLLDRSIDIDYCVRFKKKIADPGEGEDCIYYCKFKYEDGERLTPQQHLIMQNQEFRSKKMHGPMR